MNSKNVGNGEVINIGTSSCTSINEIGSMIGGDIKYIEPIIEPKKSVADISKAIQLLNWKPNTSLKSWIKKYKKELGL